MKKYHEITGSISDGVKTLKNEIPDTVKNFYAMSDAANKDGALDTKTKELIALALGVAGHCEGCIGFHAQKLVKLGASKQEVAETLGVAVYMGGGPSLMYAAEAIQAFEEFSERKDKAA